MGPLTAIGRCYLGIVTFSGRARRAEYWWFALYLFVMALVTQGAVLAYLMRDPATMMMALSDARMAEEWLKDSLAGLNSLMLALCVGWLILGALPQWTVTVRRLHDTNRSGWFILMPALVTLLAFGAFFALGAMVDPGAFGMPLLLATAAMPLIAQLWFLVVLCLRGTEGTNRFGPDPLKDAPKVAKRRAPAHPAFAGALGPDDQADLQALRRAEIKEYYRNKVLPQAQRSRPA